MQRLTLEIILRAVFGLDPGERLDALRDRLARSAAYGDKPITLLGQPPEWLEPTLNRYGPLAGFLDAAGGDRRAALRADRRAPRRPGERDDVLSILLEARHEDGTPMSQQELRDELITLLIAGHETTATTLAWAFERLVREPAALGRLVAEIDAGDGDEYLTATIHETLRRRPVLPEHRAPPGREADRGRGLALRAGGLPGPQRLPASTTTPTSIRTPTRSGPERFLDQSPGTYTWIPFGGGRRRCLGASFALLEMGIVLRAVLRAYELRPLAGKPELARRRNITVRPGGGSIGSGAARRRSPPPASSDRSITLRRTRRRRGRAPVMAVRARAALRERVRGRRAGRGARHARRPAAALGDARERRRERPVPAGTVRRPPRTSASAGQPGAQRTTCRLTLPGLRRRRPARSRRPGRG